MNLKRYCRLGKKKLIFAAARCKMGRIFFATKYQQIQSIILVKI
jgi:hypothetical protein